MQTFNQSLLESFKSDLLTDKITKAIIEIDESLNYQDFASAIAKIMEKEYGKHLYLPFLKILNEKLK